MKRLRCLPAFMLALLCLFAQAQAFVAVPPLKGHVNDLAGMLQPQQRNALENVLRDYEARTGSQIAVLLIPSTAPEAIEQYGIRVADAWKLGRQGVDDGVILIVAKDNPPALRRLRIEAGRGVQGVLTDAQSKRILQDVIAPHFRQNDFYGGLSAGVSAITTLLDKEKFSVPGKPQGAQQQEESGGLAGLLPLLFVFFIAMMMLRGRSSRHRLSSNDWGRTAGIILGSGIGNAMGRGYGGGGFGGGGFGGSGGGFSGGGGGFDGGGASGDW